MKIIHTSDIHIDSPLTSRLSPDKVKERRGELRSSFRRLIEEARAAGASAIIIAGDLFDEVRVSPRTVDYALDAISEAKDLAFFYLEGNHEGAAIRVSDRELPSNLYIFAEDWTYFEANGVTIAGRTTLCDGMFDTLRFPDGTKNIAVLHGELREGRSSSEAIGLSDAKEKGIDYLALGHYHSYSVTKIDERGIAVYSGTPEGRGFDETGEKGYVIFDTSSRAYEFTPFAKRRLHVAKVDITGALRTSEIEERAESTLVGIPRQDLVRLELVGDYSPELWKDMDGLIRKNEGSFYYFEVKDTSRPFIDPESYKNDKSLKGEFVRTVMSDESLDETEKGKIIVCGINALMGEELFGN